MRNFTVDVIGKIDNVPSFKGNALLPVYEAVVNSICSIQRKGCEPLVEVEFEYVPGIDVDSRVIGNVTITDYAEGFDDGNMDSFLMSDTTYNKEFGCKGNGRFCWLKAFEYVHIRSVYQDSDGFRLREFDFRSKPPYYQSRTDGEPVDEKPCTKVQLCGYRPEYSGRNSAYRKLRTIAEKITIHCFEYFQTLEGLEITVKDDMQTISCREIIEGFEKGSKETFEIMGEQFEITHMRMPPDIENGTHQIMLLGDNRVIERRRVNVAGRKPLAHDGKRFYYGGFVSGRILDEGVNSNRTGFHIHPDHNLDSNGEVTLTDIVESAQACAEMYLDGYLCSIRDDKNALIEKHSALFPEHRALCSRRRDEILKRMKPDSSPDELNGIIAAMKSDEEYRLRSKVDDIVNDRNPQKSIIAEEDVDSLLKDLDENLKDDLARDVIRRNLVLKLIDKRLKLNEDGSGRYHKECAIHDILFPRGNYSDEIEPDAFNLWVIDERFMFHSFAASDIPLREYVDGSDDSGRPDITIAFTREYKRQVESICIVELKRPMRDDGSSAVRQIHDYVKRIRSGKALKEGGRRFNITDRTRFYCYIICDLTEGMRDDAESRNMQRTLGGEGYYQYNNNINAYIMMMSYDELLSEAMINNFNELNRLGLAGPGDL